MFPNDTRCYLLYGLEVSEISVLWADSFVKIMFTVALPLASRWYTPQYQGLAMGIAGASNRGTALATLFAPMLAIEIGWHNSCLRRGGRT